LTGGNCPLLILAQSKVEMCDGLADPAGRWKRMQADPEEQLATWSGRFVVLPAAFEFVQEPITAGHECKQWILEGRKRLLGPRGIQSTVLQLLNSLTLSPGALDALPNVLVYHRELLEKEGRGRPNQLLQIGTQFESTTDPTDWPMTHLLMSHLDGSLGAPIRASSKLLEAGCRQRHWPQSSRMTGSFAGTPSL
jgi:hypothetical protein